MSAMADAAPDLLDTLVAGIELDPQRAVPLHEQLATALRLQLRPGAPVERITRLRTADGEPLILETAHIPGELARALSVEVLEQEAIYDALERLCGMRISHAR